MKAIVRIETGMSAYELIEAKINALELKEKSMRQEENKRTAAIEAMDRTLNNPATSRRDRLELSIELPTQRESLRHYHNERNEVLAELRGLRTAIDTIIAVCNSGGEVNQGNINRLQAILM